MVTQFCINLCLFHSPVFSGLSGKHWRTHSLPIQQLSDGPNSCYHGPWLYKTFQQHCPRMTGSTQQLGWNSPETKSVWCNSMVWSRPHTKSCWSARVSAGLAGIPARQHWWSRENRAVCNSVPAWSYEQPSTTKQTAEYPNIMYISTWNP